MPPGTASPAQAAGVRTSGWLVGAERRGSADVPKDVPQGAVSAGAGRGGAALQGKIT